MIFRAAHTHRHRTTQHTAHTLHSAHIHACSLLSLSHAFFLCFLCVLFVLCCAAALFSFDQRPCVLCERVADEEGAQRLQRPPCAFVSLFVLSCVFVCWCVVVVFVVLCCAVLCFVLLWSCRVVLMCSLLICVRV